MIKLEHVVLASPEQMEFIIEGMRNPHNSWDKSDSGRCSSIHACDIHFDHCDKCIHSNKKIGGDFAIGDNDHSLMQRLANAGTDHRKFMRMMPVYVRITAPLYWWKEFDTYKVGTVANSCSTMHKIQEKEFTWDDFSWEHLRRVRNSHLGDTVPTLVMEYTINGLNFWRNEYLDYDRKIKGRELSGDESIFSLKEKQKEAWWQMIQLLPSSYNQTRNVMMNYEVLANIYHSRKDHKLDEWRVHETPEEHKDRLKDFTSGKWGFCDWIESLPYSELITGK